ncbi:MAG TPA: hypothetical protein VFV10_13470 [Gammaproteobacteria bacterium]|nr:hypothetical protein [Gammaproteobacteria bacterium]
MADRRWTYPHFRLDFEQQQKRAKELLKAARSGDAEALARFKSSPPKLAEAQFLVARELRFDNWAHLKRHIAAMTRERDAVETLDGELRTLHVRCGSDIRATLLEAGFRGDFYEHSYPYLCGPVREGPGCLEQRARFLVDSYADSRDPPLEYEAVLEGLRQDERRLHDSADYERVAIWSELDCYDQLVLVRLLGHYAAHRRPPRLELVNVGAFPGAARFIGLGQLPPEALRLLWATRKRATPAQLQLGLDAWRALTSEDPRALAAIMRTGTPALPLLAPALHRHLRELPAVENGLSFTEAMVLELLAKQTRSLERIFVELNTVVDPLPGQGDLQVRDRVLAMERATARVYTRQAGVDRNGVARPPWTDVLTITDLGRAVLRGEVDFRSLAPPPRWVGGVEIGAENADWRWDERARDAIRF